MVGSEEMRARFRDRSLKNSREVENTNWRRKEGCIVVQEEKRVKEWFA